MNNSILIHSKAGFIPPKGEVELALKACPDVSGFAVRDAEGIAFDTHNGPTTIENVMKLLDATKDNEVFVFLAHWPKRSDGTILANPAKDIQPFVLKAGETLELAYFIEGDFAKFQNFESGRTDEGNMAADLIDPLLSEYFEMVEGDPAKFAEKLNSKTFKTMMETAVGNRGCFAFLPRVGDPVMFGQNTMGLSADWGNISQHQTVKAASAPITTQVAAVAKAAGDKFKNFLGGPTKSTADGKSLPDGVHEVPAAPLPAAPHPDGKPPAIPEQQPAPAPAKTDTAVNADNRSAVRPPPNLESSARNAWIRLFFGPAGELPKNHKDKALTLLVPPHILPFAQKPVSTKGQVEAMEKEVKALWKNAAPAESSAAAPAPSSTQVAKPSDFLPTMSDQEMAHVTGLFAKWDSRDQAKRPSPLEIQKGEASWPLFSQKVGKPLTDIMFVPVADLMELCGGNKQAVMLILELRREYAKHLDITALVNTATPKKADEIKEVPTPQSKTAAPSKSNFLGLKSATG